MIKIIITIFFIYINILNAVLIRDDFNKIIIDTTNNLIWQDSANVIEDYTSKTINDKYNWEAAFEYCNNLTINTLSNWRVPNINELKTLINYNTQRPSIYPTFIFHGSLKNQSELYYISSTSNMVDATKAWRVNFYTGFTFTEVKDNSSNTPAIYLRCVTNR
ncbi:MAG: DUF1566 domain-containing protein [Arcobacteraceae bacterium]|nr:DUF1566 domain-containing protein [Arcobacteraceae bacterium]